MQFIEILKVVLFGIIEGITEWLPVSSTGHLLLLDQILSLNASVAFKELFVIVIQFGAILAVLCYFFKDLFPWKKTKNEDTTSRIVLDKDILSLWGKVLVACLPAGIIGILFDDVLETHLHTPFVISLMLIAYGIAFLFVESYNGKKAFPIQTTNQLTYKHALLIGAFQVLALIPGTSRSGATILGALLIGVSRPAGAQFTFFLAIPVMAGASFIKLLKFFLSGSVFTGAEIGYLFIGCLVAFAVSILAVRFLMNFVKRHDFKVFGWYRIALGILVIVALVLPPLFA
jgi:undecaprenyl-diphosphatase